MLEVILQWVSDVVGVSAWIAGLVALPLLAVLLIFGTRWLLLLAVARWTGKSVDRYWWRRVSRNAAILLSLVAVGLIIRALAAEIATDLSPGSVAETERLLHTVGRFSLSTAIFLFLLWIAYRGFKAIDTWLLERSGRYTGPGHQWLALESEHVAAVGRLVLRIAWFAVLLLLLAPYVPVALSSFPATEAIAHRVMPLVLEPLAEMGLAVIAYLPNLIKIVLIAVVFRWALKLLKVFMRAVGDGEVTLGSFKPSWAAQTYRIIHIGGVILALVVIYPLLPGSGTAVFHGFAVFLGALLTFSGGSSVRSLISGAILTYSDTFDIGDRVRMGGTEGEVLDRNLLFTVIRSPNNERVSVPNASAMGHKIVNLSEASKLGGLVLKVAVEFSRHTETRQVHKLLTESARATASVRSEPEPKVLESSLEGDAVACTMVVAVDDAKQLPGARSELIQNIQQACLAADVELLSAGAEVVTVRLEK